MTADEKLKELFAALLEAVKRDTELAQTIEGIIDGKAKAKSGQSKLRRKPAPFDPFIVFQDGEDALRAKLRELDVEQLHDVVAEHGMDPAKLARKWKDKDRLIDHVVGTVTTRSRKGDAFRT